MSIVVSVYTNCAFRDFLLPAVNNTDYELILKGVTFELKNDISLDFEVMDGVWRIIEGEKYKFIGNYSERGILSNGGFFGIETINGEHISCMVRETEASLVVFKKYDLANVNKLTIGCADDNNFQYQCATFVSQHHAVLQRAERGFAIRDTSTNGTFVNYIKVNGNSPLHVGDCINIFGLKIVYLGTAIAVSSIDDSVLKTNVALREINGNTPNADFERNDKTMFHRSPRLYKKLEEEVFEIEPPPAPQAVSRKPLWMTIGPSFTMVLPMLMGSVMAILSANSSGSNSSLFMFSGIFTAISSAVVGAFWGFTNIRYAGKEASKQEKFRQERYRSYLHEKEQVIKEKYEKYSEYLTQIYPDAKEVATYNADTVALWNRNRRHEDFLWQRVGIGDIEFPFNILIPKDKFTLISDELAEKPKEIKETYRWLHNVPIAIDLFNNRLFGVVGGEHCKGAHDFMRILISQIAANNCYTDVKIVLAYDESKDDGCWDYAYWLPHVWSENKKTRYIASNKTECSEMFYELLQILRMRSESEVDKKNVLPKPYYVFVVANPELLEGEPIAKYIYGGEPSCGITTFLFSETEEGLPNECENIIKNTDETVIYNVNQEKVQKVAYDYISNEALEGFARRILAIQVNEAEAGSDIPNSLSFFGMHKISELTDFNVAENWKKNRTYDSMRALIGMKAGGAPCYLDIHEKYHGPHGLVAGTTGSGKSETLQTYMLSLALNFSPDDIGYFIIDYKGGGMAGLFEGLPHLIGSISNLSGNQVRRAMISIKSENRRRQRIFTENNVNNINSYTKLYKNGEVKTPLPHMFIIVDEFAELKREEPEFMKELVSVAQVGRSLGVHLILSTQKPSGTVDDNIWSNSKFRLCLRVQDKQDSNDMLHKPDAAYITQAGRGYLQVGNDEVYELFQSGYSGAMFENIPGGIKSEVARLLATNGRTSMTGNYQKLIQQEQMKHKWIEKLITCIAELTQETEVTLEEFSHHERRMELLFRKFTDEKISYDNTEHNAKKLDELLKLINLVLSEEKDYSVEEIASKVILLERRVNTKLPEEKKKTQLAAVVEYLENIAKEEGYVQQMQLWMPPLSERIYVSRLNKGKKPSFSNGKWTENAEWTLPLTFGVTDDPENQAQDTLMVDLAECGNIAVLGSVISGKSTFLQTVLYEAVMHYSPDWINMYALDFSSHMLSAYAKAPHCGGVLYEDDMSKIDKLFFMLETMVAERKRLFNGGNFAQYIKANGVKVPLVVVVIDNVGAFREKTDGKYDDRLLRLLKEGISYGVQFIVTAAGFNSAEISSKMADCFKTTYALQLNDKYAYCDALRINHVEIMPEINVKGRGLAKVWERILEFQIALAFEADDDYQRLEKIAEVCEQMAHMWQGHRAKEIPFIPEKPMWEEFSELESVKQMLVNKRLLPLGYNSTSADAYGIDLANMFIYLISGKSRTGKTNAQKVIIDSASRLGGEICVIEHGTYDLKGTAGRTGATYINSKQEQAEFFNSRLELIKSRNRKKQVLVEEGKDEAEIFEVMREEKPIFIVISDLVEFIQSMNRSEAGILDIRAFIKNVFEKGNMINIYFFIGLNQDTISSVLGNEIYTAATAYHVGIHFGGMADGLRYMDYSNFSYNEKNRVKKAGIGMLPIANNEETKEVVIPLLKR